MNVIQCIIAINEMINELGKSNVKKRKRTQRVLMNRLSTHSNNTPFTHNLKISIVASQKGSMSIVCKTVMGTDNNVHID